MSLCKALYGMVAMAGVGAPWPAMGSSPEREGRGEEAGARCWGARKACGGGGPGMGAPVVLLCCSVLATFCSCMKKKVAGRRRERRREGKK
jgi:hypothetical protein